MIYGTEETTMSQKSKETALDHVAFGQSPKAKNVIVSKSSEHRSSEKPVPTFSRDALDRRNFFKALGAGATVAVAVTPAAAVDPGKDETKARYRESEHVKDFYRVNRY